MNSPTAISRRTNDGPIFSNLARFCAVIICVSSPQGFNQRSLINPLVGPPLAKPHPAISLPQGRKDSGLHVYGVQQLSRQFVASCGAGWRLATAIATGRVS